MIARMPKTSGNDAQRGKRLLKWEWIRAIDDEDFYESILEKQFYHRDADYGSMPVLFVYAP